MRPIRMRSDQVLKIVDPIKFDQVFEIFDPTPERDSLYYQDPLMVGIRYGLPTLRGQSAFTDLYKIPNILTKNC
jgi:hypothetical protein